MYVGRFGAFSGATVQRHIFGSGSTHGSSSSPPSYEMCSRFASIEYGDFRPRLRSIGMPCFSAYSSSFSREFRSHSRHGAMTLMFGLSA